MFYVNSLAEKDNTLRFWSVGHLHQHKKADCSVIAYNGEVWMIDAGIGGSTHAAGFLLEYRKKLLNGGNKRWMSRDAKLRVNLIITHFHNDHVEALIESILVSPYIDIGEVYCAGRCRLDPKYDGLSKNGDYFYRDTVYALLDELHPSHILHEIPFGKENTVRFTTHTDSENEVGLTVYPMTFNPSSPEFLDYMFRLYAENGEPVPRHAYTYVLNSASLWVKVSFGKSSLLFTGDSMKRRDDKDDECMDHMLNAYKEDIGEVTLVKYPHHGYVRDPAAPGVLSFNPEYVLDTCEYATGCSKIKELYPETEIKLMNSALSTLLFSAEYDGPLTVEEL